jgi:hypothetical protein
MISMLNGVSPAPTGPTLRETNSLLISILNQTAGATISGAGGVGGPGAAMSASAGSAPPALESYGPDTDGDGIPGSLEALILTDPNRPDTDGDGFPDGLEVVLQSDPTDGRSVPSLLPPGETNGPLLSIQNLSVGPARFTRPSRGGNP